MKKSVKTIFFCSLLFGLSACSSVQPWEKGNFAKKEMSWEADSMHSTMNEQVYASKEASRGGNGSAGGGCGCN